MEFSVSLKSNRDFHRAYSKGKSAVSPYLVLYCRKNRQDMNRLGITCSVKLGSAVRRNRARRRLREIYRLHEAEFTRGMDIVAVVRSRGMAARYDKLDSEFIRLAKELELIC